MTSDIAIYHHGEFADLGELVRLKQAQGLTISLCVPVLNEEDTIGDVVRCLKGALLDEISLLDEVAVMDSGSTDRTREVAAAAGAEVYLASEILPECGPARGKGENIWKATAQLKGDIICFVDGDVRNMHPRFVYGPLGVLLKQPGIAYAKGFYDRPHAAVELGVRPAGGGRVTEALVRPLFSLFYPLWQALCSRWRESMRRGGPFLSAFRCRRGTGSKRHCCLISFASMVRRDWPVRSG